MNIIFAGTPDFAATTLLDLLKSKHNICAVYTQPDRPSGRGRKLTPSPVKKLAIEHNINIFQPENLKLSDDQQTLKHLHADIMIVVAYGVILPEAVLQIPMYGCLNIHASLLPKWRGAAPIQRCILAGDSESGVTIMQMDKGLDTGDMLSTSRCNIEANDTASSLHDKLAKLGSQALLQTLDKIEKNTLIAIPQDNNLATYAQKINKQEGRIDWQQPAIELVHKIQAFNSWPVAFCQYKDQNLRLWQAQLCHEKPTQNSIAGTVFKEDKTGIFISCAKQDSLRVTEIQLPGKKRALVKDFINSNSLNGEILN